MLLSLQERLVLLNGLPAQGDFATLRIVHDLRMDLAPDEAESVACELKQTGDRLNWNPEKAVDKDITLGGVATALIVTTLQRLNAEKKLTENHLSVYEKFMGNGCESSG